MSRRYINTGQVLIGISFVFAIKTIHMLWQGTTYPGFAQIAVTEFRVYFGYSVSIWA